MLEKLLLELQTKALTDKELRTALLSTKSSDDPLLAFCEKCKDFGYDIPLGELIASGQNFCDTMLRSVNGGGVEAEYGWDDTYELFMAALENYDK